MADESCLRNSQLNFVKRQTMEYKTIILEKKDNLAIITVNRPKVFNAINAKVIEELEIVFAALKKDNEILGIILTGAGKAFVAGADIAELSKLDGYAALELAKRGQALLLEIENIGKPVIAAINGFALGGGCEMSMACTFRVASEKAKMGQPEVKLGIIPGYGGTQRLTRLVGKGMAMELILSGDPISANEALRIGLVNHVFTPEDLLPKTEELLRKIIAQAPKAIQFAMNAINQGIEIPLEAGLENEANLFGLSFYTEDAKEGISAFLEKRPPKFNGK